MPQTTFHTTYSNNQHLFLRTKNGSERVNTQLREWSTSTFSGNGDRDIRSIGFGNLLNFFKKKFVFFDLRPCFLIILVLFINVGAYTQNNEPKRSNIPTKLRLNCKNLTSFPDTIKQHYDWIDISNVKEGPFVIDEKCRKNHNTIETIPIEELAQFNSTKIVVDKDYFHMECAALINDSLNGKVRIPYFSYDLFSFNSLDSQNLYLRDIGYFEDSTGFLFIPAQSDYLKIEKDNSEKICYVLSYPYNLSGNHTISIVVTLYRNGSCSVSPLLVDFNESYYNLDSGCFGIYKIKGKSLIMDVSYGYSMKFRLKNDKKEMHIRRIKFENFTSGVLTKRNAIFLKQ